MIISNEIPGTATSVLFLLVIIVILIVYDLDSHHVHLLPKINRSDCIKIISTLMARACFQMTIITVNGWTCSEASSEGHTH